jgi:hypothetical protein
LYPPTHTRNVAHKKAVSTLPKNEEGEVVFNQVIKLPFQVYHETVPVGTYDGIQFKALEHGSIKVLVAELVPISYGDYIISKRHAFKDVEVDQISHYGYGTLSGAATVARSYFSYNQEGKKMAPRVYGNQNPGPNMKLAQTWSIIRHYSACIVCSVIHYFLRSFFVRAPVQTVPEGIVPVPEIDTTTSKKSTPSASNLKEASRATSKTDDNDSDSISTKSTSSDYSDSDETTSSEESRRRRKKRKKAKRAKRRQRRNKKRLEKKVRETAESTMANDGSNNNIIGEFNSTTASTNIIPTCTGTQATGMSTAINDPNNNIYLLVGDNNPTMEVPIKTTELGTIHYDDEIQPVLVLQPFDPIARTRN